MVLLVTGATGGLGRRVLETFHSLGLPKDSYAGSTRDLATIPQDLKDKGIHFRQADFDSPSSLDLAFQGVTKLLIVSTNTFDSAARILQHQRAIDAAKRAGVSRVYYTSLAFGGFSDVSKMGVMEAHLATEKYLRETGVNYTSIREGVYADAFPFFLNWFPQTRKIVLPNDGPIAWTSRDELAEGTAKLMLLEGDEDAKHINKIVLLTALEAYTCREIVGAISEALGEEVVFEIVDMEAYKRSFVEAGKTEWLAEVWGTTYKGLAEGEGATTDGLLTELLGRRPVSGKEWVLNKLKADREYEWHQQGSKNGV